jgi:cellulose biosynthesis protein BcsQ
MSADNERLERGSIHTFYSFKGGVGRSMALANVAALLARWGKRVLILDWDLEAPGIEKFFGTWLEGTRRTTAGLVDLVYDFDAGAPRDWRKCLLGVKLPGHLQRIDIISAGRDDPKDEKTGYSAKLQSINWASLFEQKRFGAYLELLRQEWTAEYDFVLIDSRTGITDIGGICTIHLPDVLVCLFTTTEQSLDGVKDVMARARTRHAALPVDRQRLRLVPLPARDESRTEYKLAKQWRERFASELGPFVKDWLPRGVSIESVLDLLKLPYVAFWSFGEKLPVLEEDIDNPDKLAYFYHQLGRLLLSHLDFEQIKTGTVANEAAAAAQAEAAKRAIDAEQARVLAQADAARRAADKDEAERRKREEQYFNYLRDRWSPALRELRLRAYALFLGGASLFALGSLGLLRPIWLADAFTSSTSAILVACGVAVVAGAALNYLSWLYFRRMDRLKGQRSMFDAQADPYSAPDFRDLPRFIQTSEALLLRESKVIVPATFDVDAGVGVAPNDIVEGGAAVREASPRASVRSRSGPYDVFISYRREKFVTDWLHQHFLPLFQSWLSDELGREANIFVDTSLVPGGDWAQETQEALRASPCLVALVTPAYFQSEFCTKEWNDFRARHEDALLPVLLRGSFERLPKEVARLSFTDFREFALVGVGFQKTEAYVEFQRQVRNLVERVGAILERSPQNADLLRSATMK